MCKTSPQTPFHSFCSIKNIKMRIPISMIALSFIASVAAGSYPEGETKEGDCEVPSWMNQPTKPAAATFKEFMHANACAADCSKVSTIAGKPTKRNARHCAHCSKKTSSYMLFTCKGCEGKYCNGHQKDHGCVNPAPKEKVELGQHSRFEKVAPI
jgi:hypothetical protein